MARRWLLTMLTGTALSIGFAGTASASELVSDPVTVETAVATATVTADSAERTVDASLATDATVEELDTEIAPTVTTGISDDGPSVDAEGPVTVAGNEVPVPQVADPVDEAVEEPVETAPTQDQTAAGSGVSAAPAPAGQQETGSVRHSSTVTADRAAYRSGLRAGTTTMDLDDASVLAPEIAPPGDALPLVAAAAPTIATDLALPVIDTTPTVPGLLRLLAGLLVVGAAATWRTVRDELA